VRWDESKGTLSGKAMGPPGTSWQLAIYAPPEYLFDQNGSADGSGLSDIIFQQPVLRAKLRFDAAGQRDWSVRFVKH